MWQQSGSDNMIFEDVKKYINEINEKRFADFNDWRLPTLEEGLSLMEPKQKNSFYIDPIFDNKQRFIWTADKLKVAVAQWVVGFYGGYCFYFGTLDSYSYVRAVRSGQLSGD